MKKFIVKYENISFGQLMYEKILVHAKDYHEARKKAEGWLNEQNFRSGKIIQIDLYNFREEVF